MSGIKTGDPVILKDAEGLDQYNLESGAKGWANSVLSVPKDDTGAMSDLIVFMPEDGKGMFYIDISRVELDKERSDMQLELNESTISKG